MTGIDELFDLIPVNDIAAKLGVDADTARQGIGAALPAILGGLGANAQDPAGAASLSKALASKDVSLIDGGVNVDQIDTEDGSKIIRNVFGDKTEDVTQALGAAGGGQGSGLIAKLLPLLAPIVLSFLAKRGGGTQSGAVADGGGIGDLLGGLLGGGGQGGGGLGDLLGGQGGLGDLLGGAQTGGAGGGLGDLLGGLLGGGKR